MSESLIVADSSTRRRRDRRCVFDPVALAILKRSARSVTADQRALAEQIERVDAARAKVRTADSLDARAELATELTKLKPMLARYNETAPSGTKELISDQLGKLDRELESVTKPTSGTAEQVTTPDGYEVTQRLRFEKPEPAASRPDTASADMVRKVADLTTRPMGAIMIYSLVKKQGALQDARTQDEIDLPEYLLGTAHTAYGVSVGVRMLHKIEVSPTEFAILGVIDVLETASHHYDSVAEQRTAITYSIVRNGLQVGLAFVGGV